MRSLETTSIFTDTSPSSPSTVISLVPFSGDFKSCEVITVTGLFAGATGGTLDIILQHKVAPNVWVDWAHFPQIIAAAANICYNFSCEGTGVWAMNPSSRSTDTTVAGTFLAAPGNTNIQPGRAIRAVFLAGAGTSAGAAQTIIINGYRSYT